MGRGPPAAFGLRAAEVLALFAVRVAEVLAPLAERAPFRVLPLAAPLKGGNPAASKTKGNDTCWSEIDLKGRGNQ